MKTYIVLIFSFVSGITLSKNLNLSISKPSRPIVEIPHETYINRNEINQLERSINELEAEVAAIKGENMKYDPSRKLHIEQVLRHARWEVDMVAKRIRKLKK